MALIVKYKFQNVDADGNSISLLPQFPSDVSYTNTDVVEGNITTRVIETDDLSKVTYIRFGCNDNTYVEGAWEYLTEILYMNMSYINTFQTMFRGCKSLNKLDVSNWDTSKVTNMYCAFAYCAQLTQLDVSNWDTSSVTNIGYMFYNCSQLTQLDVSNWDTSSVTNMGNMFYNCPQLTQLDVSNWDTSKVTHMAGMFQSCTQLTQLDVSNWDTSKVTNMSSMFNGCPKLVQLDVSNWDTSKVINMSSMFRRCFELTSLDVSNWDTSSVTNMGNMFCECPQLTQLDVSNLDTSNVTIMSSMFSGCSQLTQLDVSNWNTSKVTSMSSVFNNCLKLTQLDVSNWDTSNVIEMSSMFNQDSQLTQLDLSNWNTSKVTNMYNMFCNCAQLTRLNLSGWNTSSVNHIHYMFYGCRSLTLLDLSNFNTSKVTNTTDMFKNCNVKNVGLIYCSENTINKLANCITSPCNFYVTNKTYTSPNTLVKYVMYREDKKRILYYNDETQTWEKPILRKWDTIEKHADGKYYYHKRSGEVVLDGSEDEGWGLNSSGSIAYSRKIPNVKAPINNASIGIIPFLCDKLMPTYIDDIYNGSVEGIAISKDSNIGISSNGRDLSGFTQWLQANNVTVVYQLAEEKVYECTNLDLITYANETNLLVKSGVLNPKVSLKVSKGVGNTVTMLQNKVTMLEQMLFNLMPMFNNQQSNIDE